MREGTEDDVRYDVNANALRDVFDELVLRPPAARLGGVAPSPPLTNSVEGRRVR